MSLSTPIGEVKTAQQILIQTDSTLLASMPIGIRVAALLRRASAFGYLKQPESELATLHRAVNEQTSWRTLTSRAQFYHRHGDYKLELEDRLQVVELEPADARARDKLASAYRRLTMWKEALEQYTRFRDMMEDAGKETQMYDEIHLNCGICYQGLKQYLRAVDEYDTLLQRVKHHRRAQLYKAECLMEMGKKEKAIDLLKEIQQHAVKHIDSETRARAILLLAKEARARQDHKSADTYLQGAKAAISNSRLSKVEKDKECKEIDRLRSIATSLPDHSHIPSQPIRQLPFAPPALLIQDEKDDKTLQWLLPTALFDDVKSTNYFVAPIERFSLPSVPSIQTSLSREAKSMYYFDTFVPFERSSIPSIHPSSPLLYRRATSRDVYRWALQTCEKKDAMLLLKHGCDGEMAHKLTLKSDEEAILILKFLGVNSSVLPSIREAFVECG